MVHLHVWPQVAVYGCALDTAGTETKGTVLVRNVRLRPHSGGLSCAVQPQPRCYAPSDSPLSPASRQTGGRTLTQTLSTPVQAAELEGYAAGEEKKIEDAIKAIADTGAKVVVTGQSVGEMALHFLEKFGLMVIKIPSKFELRRFCRTVNAVALIKLDPPQADELGFVSSIAVEEIGGTRCVVVRQEDATSNVSTVVIRGATDNAMDDVERAVDDGINGYKALCKDARLVPAGGASEIEIAARLSEFGRKETGLDQYAIQKFAQALEVVPRTLAENAGLNATDVIAQLYAAHAVRGRLCAPASPAPPIETHARAATVPSIPTRRCSITLSTHGRACLHPSCSSVGGQQECWRGHRGRPSEGLQLGLRIRPVYDQVVGAQARARRRDHRPQGGPNHHGQAGGRAQGATGRGRRRGLVEMTRHATRRGGERSSSLLSLSSLLFSPRSCCRRWLPVGRPYWPE